MLKSIIRKFFKIIRRELEKNNHLNVRFVIQFIRKNEGNEQLKIIFSSYKNIYFL